MGGGYNWIDASVVCPFYKTAEGRCITCTGGMAKDTETRTTFRRGADRERYMRHYCQCDAYKTCVLAVAASLQHGYEAPTDREVKRVDADEAS